MCAMCVFPQIFSRWLPPSSTNRVTGKMFYPIPSRSLSFCTWTRTARHTIVKRSNVYLHNFPPNTHFLFTDPGVKSQPSALWRQPTNQPTTHHLWRDRVLRQVRQSSSGHVRPIPCRYVRGCGKRFSDWTCPSLAKDQPDEEEEKTGLVWHVYGVNSTRLGTLHGPVIACWKEGCWGPKRWKIRKSIGKLTVGLGMVCDSNLNPRNSFNFVLKNVLGRELRRINSWNRIRSSSGYIYQI